MVLDPVERERQILDRILGLKQMLNDGVGGPVELHELAVCYFHLENFRKASERLAELHERYPDYVEISAAYALRCLALIHCEELAAAEQLLRSRLTTFASDVRLLSMLAHIEYIHKRFGAAIELHRRILQLDPDNLNSLNSLGYLLALHGERSEQAEALQSLSKAITRRPDHPAYLDSLGVYFAQNGDRQRARRALEKALKQAPENGEILDHLKRVLQIESTARRTAP